MWSYATFAMASRGLKPRPLPRRRVTTHRGVDRLYGTSARQFRQLRQHYEDLDRPEAVRRLIAAEEEASRKIEANLASGVGAPPPYPHLARPRRAWIKVGPYWISYSTTQPPVIVAAFHETADIPGRL